MFVTFYFHDNDFINPLHQAMKMMDGYYNLASFSERPEVVKEAVCHLMEGMQNCMDVMWRTRLGKSHLDYFRDHGRVMFTRQTPDNGGNGSAVSIDLDTHYIWIH